MLCWRHLPRTVDVHLQFSCMCFTAFIAIHDHSHQAEKVWSDTEATLDCSSKGREDLQVDQPSMRSMNVLGVATAGAAAAEDDDPA